MDINHIKHSNITEFNDAMERSQWFKEYTKSPHYDIQTMMSINMEPSLIGFSKLLDGINPSLFEGSYSTFLKDFLFSYSVSSLDYTHCRRKNAQEFIAFINKTYDLYGQDKLINLISVIGLPEYEFTFDDELGLFIYEKESSPAISFISRRGFLKKASEDPTLKWLIEIFMVIMAESVNSPKPQKRFRTILSQYCNLYETLLNILRDNAMDPLTDDIIQLFFKALRVSIHNESKETEDLTIEVLDTIDVPVFIGQFLSESGGRFQPIFHNRLMIPSDHILIKALEDKMKRLSITYDVPDDTLLLFVEKVKNILHYEDGQIGEPDILGPAILVVFNKLENVEEFLSSEHFSKIPFNWYLESQNWKDLENVMDPSNREENNLDIGSPKHMKKIIDFVMGK